MREVEGVGDGDVGGGEGLTRHIGRARQLPRDEGQSAAEDVDGLARGPVVVLIGRRDVLGYHPHIHRHGEARFAEMQELLVEREGRIRRRGGERRVWRLGPITGDQVFHDGDALDHRDAAIGEGRDVAGGIDGQKFRVVLGAFQKIDAAQFVGEAHLLQQPDDAEAAAFAPDGEHGLNPPAGR